MNQKELTPHVQIIYRKMFEIIEDTYREGRNKGFLEGYEKGAIDKTGYLKGVVKDKARCHDCVVVGLLESPIVEEELRSGDPSLYLDNLRCALANTFSSCRKNLGLPIYSPAERVEKE